MLQAHLAQPVTLALPLIDHVCFANTPLSHSQCPCSAPKKGTKMSLNDFLTDDSTGKTSWADDIDDLPIARECQSHFSSLSIGAWNGTVYTYLFSAQTSPLTTTLFQQHLAAVDTAPPAAETTSPPCPTELTATAPTLQTARPGSMFPSQTSLRTLPSWAAFPLM